VVLSASQIIWENGLWIINGKRYGRKWWLPNFRYWPNIFLEEVTDIQ
jgi:hypothetical protein